MMQGARNPTAAWTACPGPPPSSNAGKIINKIKGFPAQHRVKVFRVVLPTQRSDVEVVQDVCGFRWKVEQFHRETKLLTGLEAASAAMAAGQTPQACAHLASAIRLAQAAGQLLTSFPS